MAANGNSFVAKVARWKVMAAHVRTLIETRPHLLDLLTRLERLIAEAEAMENQQGELRADLQGLNKQRVALAREGDEVRSRLASGLHLEHGFKSERLLQFGLKPRRGPRPRGAGSVIQQRAASSPQKPAAEAGEPGAAT